MAVRVMRLAPQEMCTASYERAKAVPLARRVVLVMTQMAALFALAPATIYVLLTELLKRHRCSSLRAVPLTSLQQDLEPVGTLEEVLVEKIAIEPGEFAESRLFANADRPNRTVPDDDQPPALSSDQPTRETAATA
jgi:hypothetical protein